MFPISSDGVFEESSIDKFIEDLLVDIPTLEGNENSTANDVKKRPRKVEEISNEGSSDFKKTAHKLTEKQRRKEMTSLYASLRSLLPIEYIKGKRAISDHMHEAVNHINDTKKKIEEMKRRREGLRKARRGSASCTDVEAEVQNSNAGDSPYCVEINLFGDEFEILISSTIHKEGFPLSMVLEDLLGRQLNVINCFSTRGDQCFLHKILVEINGSASIDISELQEALVNLLKLS